MYPYRFPAAQLWERRNLGQETTPVPAPAYAGVPGLVETAAVLGVSAAAAWTGIRAGMKEKGLLQVAGYVGGVGAGLVGLLYLGGKFNVGGIPAVRVIPA